MTETAPTGFESATEAVEAQQTSYESLVESDFVPAKARDLLKNADNRRTRVRQQYAAADQNADLVDEAKEREKDEIYERNQAYIQNTSEQARDALLSEARLKERQARPWPVGQSKDLSNNTELLSLAYAESERLARLAEKRAKITVGGKEKPNPMFNMGDFLRSKYAEGIGIGGAQGSALCAGVLRAAEELGVSEEEVVEPLRTDDQRQKIDDARRLEMLATSVSTDTPKPRRGRRGALRGGQPPNLLIGDNGTPTFAGRSSRKPSWK